MKYVTKGWGREVVIHNDTLYCMKLLQFKKGGTSSLHFHLLKTETWYINSGEFILKKINTDTADITESILKKGDTIVNNPGEPHQLIAITEGEVVECSTQHFDSDSYRVQKGDSQQ